MSQEEQALLSIMASLHYKQRKHFAIKKEKYEKLSVLEIQNRLTRDYHFYKWHLVEVLEI